MLCRSFQWLLKVCRFGPYVFNPEMPLILFPNQEFLHSKDLLHGNICARSVLVTKDFTAKLWGLHGVYTRKNQGATQKDDPSKKKWQAPELLAKRPAGQSSDMWVCLFSSVVLSEFRYFITDTAAKKIMFYEYIIKSVDWMEGSNQRLPLCVRL